METMMFDVRSQIADVGIHVVVVTIVL